MALKWASELLRGSDQVRHGVDLFGRDALVLGRLLMTLVSCAAVVLGVAEVGRPWTALTCLLEEDGVRGLDHAGA